MAAPCQNSLHEGEDLQAVSTIGAEGSREALFLDAMRELADPPRPGHLVESEIELARPLF